MQESPLSNNNNTKLTIGSTVVHGKYLVLHELHDGTKSRVYSVSFDKKKKQIIRALKIVSINTLSKALNKSLWASKIKWAVCRIFVKSRESSKVSLVFPDSMNSEINRSTTMLLWISMGPV